MSLPFLSALPLSRHGVDRDHATRSDAAGLEALWSGGEARVLLLHRGLALSVRGAGPVGWDGFGTAPAGSTGPVELALRPVTELPDGLRGHRDGVRLYLGRALTAEATPLFALWLTDAEAGLVETEGSNWVNLRLVATMLDDTGAGVFTEALAVFNWHATHGHCPRCGAASVPEAGGWVRRCPVEDIELFPRTDPAVIVGIIDAEDRILLGSNALWETNRFSLLAGFVEPGESFEAAAVREIAEESGVVIDEPEYLGSQPWPFPASIMVGFLARVSAAHPPVLRPDGDEILELRWFTREQIADPAGDVLLPGRSSIARAIIERWYGGPLPEKAAA
ncbi:MAG: NAD(+) diphosphatase [Herbiconiux sp.]|nr:NAD(+) diphosphatase [Herbiconiux sp.]